MFTTLSICIAQLILIPSFNLNPFICLLFLVIVSLPASLLISFTFFSCLNYRWFVGLCIIIYWLIICNTWTNHVHIYVCSKTYIVLYSAYRMYALYDCISLILSTVNWMSITGAWNYLHWCGTVNPMLTQSLTNVAHWQDVLILFFYMT